MDVGEKPSARDELHWSDVQQIVSRTTLILLPGLEGTGDLFAPVVDALGPSRVIAALMLTESPVLAFSAAIGFPLGVWFLRFL